MPKREIVKAKIFALFVKLAAFMANPNLIINLEFFIFYEKYFSSIIPIPKIIVIIYLIARLSKN